MIVAFLGLFGYIVTTKLFERSMVHLSLSEAYRETIEALVRSDVQAHLPVGDPRVLRLPYVKNAVGKTGFYPAGPKFTERGPSFPIETATHDAVDPRPIVIPLHNESAKFHGRPLATMRLNALWNGLFFGIVIIGLGLSTAVIFGPKNRRIEPAAPACCLAPTEWTTDIRNR